MKNAPFKYRKTDSSWEPVLGLVHPHRVQVIALAVFSFAGAMLEAALLVTLTAAAIAITEGRTSVPILGGLFSIPFVIGGLGGILLARLLLALLGVNLSARLAADVLGAARLSLATAFLGANWSVQHAEPAGRLQELLTTFANQATHSVKAFTNWLTSWLSLTAFLVAAVVVDAFAAIFVLIALAVLGGGPVSPPPWDPST